MPWWSCRIPRRPRLIRHKQPPPRKTSPNFGRVSRAYWSRMSADDRRHPDDSATWNKQSNKWIGMLGEWRGINARHGYVRIGTNMVSRRANLRVLFCHILQSLVVAVRWILNCITSNTSDRSSLLRKIHNTIDTRIAKIRTPANKKEEYKVSIQTWSRCDSAVFGSLTAFL